jgi:hypothetical protein
MLHHLGPHGVSLDVSHHCQEMTIRLNRKRTKSLLEQMAADRLAQVDSPCVPAMSLANGPGQGILPLRYHHQMDMICHEAPRPYPEFVSPGKLGKHFHVRLAVLVRGEDFHRTHAPLNHMMGEFRCDNASEASHTPTLLPADPNVKQIDVSCPRQYARN